MKSYIEEGHLEIGQHKETKTVINKQEINSQASVCRSLNNQKIRDFMHEVLELNTASWEWHSN